MMSKSSCHVFSTVRKVCTLRRPASKMRNGGFTTGEPAKGEEEREGGG